MGMDGMDLRISHMGSSTIPIGADHPAIGCQARPGGKIEGSRRRSRYPLSILSFPFYRVAIFFWMIDGMELA
jgi:hypothetical protein